MRGKRRDYKGGGSWNICDVNAEGGAYTKRKVTHKNWVEMGEGSRGKRINQCKTYMEFYNKT